MSLPSPEDLEALGYSRLPPQGNSHEPDRRPLAEVQMSLCLRIAEGKLQALRNLCRDKRHLVYPANVLRIIGGEEEGTPT